MLALLDLEEDEVVLGGDQLHHVEAGSGGEAPPLRLLIPSASRLPSESPRRLKGGLLFLLVCWGNTIGYTLRLDWMYISYIFALFHDNVAQSLNCFNKFEKTPVVCGLRLSSRTLCCQTKCCDIE